jgi:hypothetical protein
MQLPSVANFIGTKFLQAYSTYFTFFLEIDKRDIPNSVPYLSRVAT